MRVHTRLGPGLLEQAYKHCLRHELDLASIPCQSEADIPVNYDGTRLDCGYRADLIVANQVILELKSVERIAPLHEAQLLTYLRLSGCRVGLLLNFNVIALKQGIHRRVM